ncbi:MAG: glycosyltransferase family 2 protein [Clostridia bacterium]|nr:glycosyltransferase family 2 protein [Clostridia bacterium]
MKPEISIIVPVYRVESFLTRCIDSILDQTFRDIELILVDDGSPDACGEICDTYAERDSRIRVIHKKNGGVSSARNAGIELARGRYIMFCDGDDYADPEWCSALHGAAERYNDAFISCNCRRERADGSESKPMADTSGDNETLTDYYGIFRRGVSGSACLKIFSVDKIKNAALRFDEGRSIGEDAVFCAEYAALCKGAVYLPRPLYHYVSNVYGAMSLYRYDMLSLQLPIMSARLPLISEGDREDFLRWHYSYFYSMLDIVFDPRNTKMTRSEKYAYSNRMLRSAELGLCIKHGTKNEKFYIRWLLKTRNYRLIRLFRNMCGKGTFGSGQKGKML